MIKKFAIIITFIILGLLVTGCEIKPRKTSIVCTNFAQYDWTMSILGEQVSEFDVYYLLEGGAEFHSFEPTTKDIVTIKNADLLIYIGGESDLWLESILKSGTNPNMVEIKLLEIVKLLEADEPNLEDEDDHDHEYDEHVWLSLKNAISFVEAIYEAIVDLDPENQEIYNTNKLAYQTSLTTLDLLYQEMVENCTNPTILIADRNPFKYLLTDYNINYFAAFTGCASEIEATPSIIAFLTDTVNQLEINYLIVLETSDQKLANTIKNNSQAKNQVILVLNACQSVTKYQYQIGYSYLGIMQDNLYVLQQALN